jgi:hypothetical protein
MFSEGRTLLEDEQRNGRPSTIRTSDNTTRVRELVRSDRRLRVNMIADEVNLKREAVRRILTEELGTRKVCAKMVPRNLTVTAGCAAAELLEQVEADPELSVTLAFLLLVLQVSQINKYRNFNQTCRSFASWYFCRTPLRRFIFLARSQNC